MSINEGMTKGFYFMSHYETVWFVENEEKCFRVVVVVVVEVNTTCESRGSSESVSECEVSE